MGLSAGGLICGHLKVLVLTWAYLRGGLIFGGGLSAEFYGIFSELNVGGKMNGKQDWLLR